MSEATSDIGCLETPIRGQAFACLARYALAQAILYLIALSYLPSYFLLSKSKPIHILDLI